MSWRDFMGWQPPVQGGSRRLARRGLEPPLPALVRLGPATVGRRLEYLRMQTIAELQAAAGYARWQLGNGPELR